MRPADAESLLHSCGVTGESQAIQNYLKRHCDCHPLVTGALAGLINNYLPDRGNFDAWSTDQAGGGQLNLANLDLIQKRNHILKAALDALVPESRELLSTLALLSEAVDYPALSALNPDFSQQELSEIVNDLDHRGLLQYDAQTKRYDLHPVVRHHRRRAPGAGDGALWPARSGLFLAADPRAVRQGRDSRRRPQRLARSPNLVEDGPPPRSLSRP